MSQREREREMGEKMSQRERGKMRQRVMGKKDEP